MRPFLAVLLITTILAAGVLSVGRLGILDSDPDKILAQYGAPPSQFVVVDGTRVHFRDEGTGPTLVLIHGSRASLHQWDGWVAQLKSHFRIVRLDTLGHGLTGADAKDDYSASRGTILFKGLLDHLGIERFILAGTSSGATEAVRFAAENPARVEKLLVSTVPLKLPAETKSTPYRRGIIWLHNDVLGSNATNLYWRNFLEGIYGDPAKVTDEAVERYRALNGLPGQQERQQRRVSIWMKNGGAARDFELAGKITAPTLVQWGAAGPVLPKEIQCQITSAFKSAEVRVITYPTLGHKLVMEDPVTTAQDAMRFLLHGIGGSTCDADRS